MATRKPSRTAIDEASIRTMHDAALRVLADRQSAGEPFALFLSSWSFDERRQQTEDFLEELSVVERVPRNIQVRIGLERQVRILLQTQHLETVAVYRQGDLERIAIPQEWPSLTLSNAEWRDRVVEAASSADLIVVFWGTDSPGLNEELRICSAPSNRLKTVVVIPSTPVEIYLSQVVTTLPRLVPLAEIPPFFALHSEFTPLIDRMTAIQTMDPRRRAALVDPKKRVKKFPWPATSGRLEGKVWVEP
jgi:hypothetical protein